MNDKTVFFWESSTPTLICILTHWAMVSSGLRDQHMHAGLYYTWQRVFSLVYLLWVFGAFWCKRILSFKDNVPDDISCFHIHCECLARIFSIVWKDWTLNSSSLSLSADSSSTETLYYLISINLLAFYHEWRPMIGYATHVLFKQ